MESLFYIQKQLWFYPLMTYVMIHVDIIVFTLSNERILYHVINVLGDGYTSQVTSAAISLLWTASVCNCEELGGCQLARGVSGR
jgi:hypothetical protein